MNVDDYVFSYANIRYENDCVVSSDFEAVIPSELGNAVATDTRSDELPGGASQWRHAAPAEGVGGIEGFRPINNQWGTASAQFADPKWRAPKGADLTFKFYCTQPQTLVLGVNHGFSTQIEITASDDWQRMTLPASFLKHANGSTLGDWSDVKKVEIKPAPGSDITKVVFAEFQWVTPKEQPAVEMVGDAEGRFYLAREMASKAESFLHVRNDRSWEGKTLISVGGKMFERGLGVHADSEIVYRLDREYSSFHVVPGPDDAHQGIIEMKILVDGKQVFNSGRVNSHGYQARALDIPVKGAKTLTLIVTDGGNGAGGDHAAWADAYLRVEN